MVADELTRELSYLRVIPVGLLVMIGIWYIDVVEKICDGVDNLERTSPNAFYTKEQSSSEPRLYWIPVLLALWPVSMLSVKLAPSCQKWSDWYSEQLTLLEGK